MKTYFLIIDKLISMPKSLRILLLISIDIFTLFFSIVFSEWLIKDNFFNFKILFNTNLVVLNFLIIITYIFSGQYKSITRFAGSKEIYNISIRNFFVIFIFYSVYKFFEIELFSIRQIFLTTSLTIIFSSISRILIRDIINNFFRKHYSGRLKRVVIYGAGSAGVQLYSTIKISNNYSILAFIDDDKKLYGRNINGIPILPRSDLNKFKNKLDNILFAIPSIRVEDKKDILNDLQKFNIPIFKIPSLDELSKYQVKINDLRPLNIDDLLGREPIIPDKNLLNKGIKNKIICITGAGGSIGSQLCKEILLLHPKRIVLIERNEHSLYKLENNLFKLNLNKIPITSLLGCMTNKNFVLQAFKKNKVDIVFHCAAYKHVPIVEKNPIQSIYNNVLSALLICSAAENTQIKKVILVSSDKAVRPTNVMGASKRLCELIFQAYADKEKKIRSRKIIVFSMVRFGNVLGSSGSVVPLFQKQIEEGGPVTLTHKNVIRYFMSIKEASQLVLQASSMAKGGEIFLLNMGKPVKIYDLASHMISLNGLKIKNKNNPFGDIEIKTTGLRPGEKLYEELIIDGESMPTKHPLIFFTKEKFIPIEKLQINLNKLEDALLNNDQSKSIKILKNLVKDWNSDNY